MTSPNCIGCSAFIIGGDDARLFISGFILGAAKATRNEVDGVERALCPDHHAEYKRIASVLAKSLPKG